MEDVSQYWWVQERENILIAALEAMEYFVAVNRQGRIVYITEPYAITLGTRAAAVIGKFVEDIIPGTRLMKIMESGQEEVGTLMDMYDNQVGQVRTHICSRRPIYREGQIIGAIGYTILNNFEEAQILNEEIEQLKAKNADYQKKLERLQRNANPLGRLIGTSRAMQALKQEIEDYADSGLSVLITGETGTGKELVAKAIHHCSSRSLHHYIKINCAAIPKDLIESELFGYEEGAFTGAKKGGKPGKFLLADGGTLLLDEIGELPLSVQAKLLRVLQEQEVEPVGGTKPLPINVRLLSSTNRNLREMVAKGEFREDLYYRINIVELRLPSLRERRSDIGDLCRYFVEKYSPEAPEVSEQVIAMLETYPWPGNIRELEHAVERACVLSRGQALLPKHFQFMEEKGATLQKPLHETRRAGLKEEREALEQEHIRKAIETAGGNKAKAARMLGIDRSVLYRKMKSYGMPL